MWLDTADVASRYGVERRTVQRWVQQRRIPHTRLGGPRGRVRFTEDQLTEFERRTSFAPIDPVDVHEPNPRYQPTTVVVPMRTTAA